jgi:hypothetical protein
MRAFIGGCFDVCYAIVFWFGLLYVLTHVFR